MSLEALNIKKFSDRAIQIAPEFDSDGLSKVTPFGVSFLDKLTRGILRDDLVMIGAPTGIGKTSLVEQITFNAGLHGKRAVGLALEATEGEWEMRTKFRLYARLLLRDKGEKFLARYTYRDFKLGLLREHLAPYRDQVEAEINRHENVSIFYRGRDFGIDEFTRIFNALNDKADLIVVDHIHYFDTSDENENRAFTEIMKRIRDLNQLTKIPVVVVGHLRKKDRANPVLVPDENDFHGTSNLAKIATILITMAPGEPLSANRFGTYFKVAKCRDEGHVRNYVGLGTFNTLTNEYERDFVLGKLTDGGRAFEPIPVNRQPPWYSVR